MLIFCWNTLKLLYVLTEFIRFVKGNVPTGKTIYIDITADDYDQQFILAN